MRFFDLHCDTAYEIYKRKAKLYKNDLHVSVDRFVGYEKYIGCFAVWLPEEHVGEAAIKLFDEVVDKFDEEIRRNDRFIKKCVSSKDLEGLSSGETGESGAILTIEGGALLGGDLNKLKRVYDRGVRLLTLTWNGRNEIGDGVGVEGAGGITEFGIKALKEMERLGMIVDVSHASERLFYDVAEFTNEPFVATHSNSKVVCGHRRNLADEQFGIIRDRGGVVGINFSRGFLTDSGKAGTSDIVKHIERFLSLSGENTVAIGSDFDGTDMPDGVSGIESMGDLREFLLRLNYPEELVDKIFYYNAYEFFRKHI